MHEAAKVLLGRHDFTTFRSTQCQANSPLRTLDRLDVSRHGDLIEVKASARSFLHNQVRSMVGSLKRVGEGGWTAADLKAALEAHDRAACGQVAPPDGLLFSIERRLSGRASSRQIPRPTETSGKVTAEQRSAALQPNSTSDEATNMPTKTAVPTAAPLPIVALVIRQVSTIDSANSSSDTRLEIWLARRQEKPDQRRAAASARR